MKKFCCLLYGLIPAAFAGYGATAQDVFVKELLQRVDSAHTYVHTIEYNAVVTITTPDLETPFILPGHVIAQRMGVTVRDLNFRLQINCVLLDTAYTYIFNGSAAIRHNHNRRYSVMGDSSSGILGLISGGAPRNLLSYRLLSHTRMSEALRYTTRAEYLGVVLANGIRCHRIRLLYPDDDITSNRERVYDIGVQDLLPRYQTEIYLLDGKEHRTELSMDSITVNMKLDTSVFSTAPLPGYRVEQYRWDAPPPLLAPGTTAPDWALVSGAGEQRTLSQFSENIVLLDFWYTTCAPCIRSIPMLQRIHERFRNRGVAVFGVNCFDTKKADPAGFLRRKGATYETLLHGEDVAARYNVSGYPSLYIIGRDGTIIFARAGYGEGAEEEIAAVLEKHLKNQDR